MTFDQIMEVNKSLEEMGIENVENVVLIKSGATNGDVIKAMFPNAKITDHFELGTPIGNIIYIRLCKYQEMRVQQEWWNAPYKREGDKE